MLTILIRSFTFNVTVKSGSKKSFMSTGRATPRRYSRGSPATCGGNSSCGSRPAVSPRVCGSPPGGAKRRRGGIRCSGPSAARLKPSARRRRWLGGRGWAFGSPRPRRSGTPRRSSRCTSSLGHGSRTERKPGGSYDRVSSWLLEPRHWGQTPSDARASAIASTPRTVTRRKLGVSATGHVESFTTTVWDGPWTKTCCPLIPEA